MKTNRPVLCYLHMRNWVILVEPPHKRSNLSGHCDVRMLVWLFAQIQNFENFIRSQKFQNQNVFQVILSNFDLLTLGAAPPPPPPPPPGKWNNTTFGLYRPRKKKLSKIFFYHISKIFKPNVFQAILNKLLFVQKKFGQKLFLIKFEKYFNWDLFQQILDK